MFNLPLSIEKYKKLSESSNKSSDRISVVSWINPRNKDSTQKKLKGFEDMGIERIICGLQYDSLKDYLEQIDLLKSSSLAS